MSSSNTLGFLLSLLLFSCTNEELSGERVKPEEERDVFISFKLASTSASAVATRAIDEDIYAYEHRVESVWILLYSEYNEELVHKFEFEVNNWNDNHLIDFTDLSPYKPAVLPGTGEKLAFQTLPLLVKDMDYKVVAFANPENLISSLPINNPKIGDKLSDLLSVKIGLSGGFGGLGETNSMLFFMSNANGLITISRSELGWTENEAIDAPINVAVDRVLAKIIVNEDRNGLVLEPRDAVRLEGLRWYPNVVNKHVFLIRQFADLADGTPELAGSNTGAGRKDVYATDPNFDGGASDNFIYKGDGAYNPVRTKWNAVADPAGSEPTRQYVTENTMSLDAQKHTGWIDYTTHVVVEATLIYPEFLKNQASQTDPGRNYYSYNEGTSANPDLKVFTHEQVRFWMQRGYPQEMSNLKAKVDANIAANSGGNAESFDFSSDNLPGTTDVATYFGITYHPNGLNIYKMPVRHFKGTSSNPQAEVYGHFGVVRNNTYTINITSITGPGTGMEWDDHFISADISVTPWYSRDFQNNEELGYD